MYKTAVITDEISQDLRVAAGLIKKFGLDALELRSVNEKNPFQMSMDDFRAARAVAHEHGLGVCCIASPMFKCELGDETAYAEHLDGLKRCVEAAHLLKTKLIRVFTFFNDGKGRESFPAIADRFQKAVAIAKDGGVTLIIESEPSVCTYNFEELRRFLDLLDSPCVAALLDAGNEITDEGAPPPYPDGYERIKPLVRHVHIKDTKRSGALWEPALLGRGDVDYHGLFARLKADGYDGYVSLETHFRFKEALNDDLLVRPQGSQFSEGGYEATEASLNILRDDYDWMCEK